MSISANQTNRVSGGANQELVTPSRERMEIISEIFDRFAVKDQQSYYLRTINKNRASGKQVNFARAFLAFLGGAASALVGTLASAGNDNSVEIGILVLVAVIAPALGAAFASLLSLYQWERMTAVYEDALNNVYVADALSPVAELADDKEYYDSLMAFVDATLDIMREETSQFGNLLKSSEQISEFLSKSKERSESINLFTDNQALLSHRDITDDVEPLG